MNIGDKVRFLHSKGEGIIRKVVDARTYEVEIEDGFIIPVLRTDIVKVSGDENKISGRTNSDQEITFDTPLASVKENPFLALIPFNDKIYSVFIVNTTSRNILYTYFTNDGNQVKGVASGTLKRGETIKVNEADISQFEKWPEYIIQMLFFTYGNSIVSNPFTKRIKFKASSFFKKKQTIPIIDKEGYLISLEQGESIKLPGNLTEKMFEEEKSFSYQEAITKPEEEIDLHIEKLVSDFSKMSPSEILDLQVKTFETKLDNAIASGMDEIVFIHGVGNGILKTKIHKILSQHKNIRFFKDAKKEKFGFGATMVRIK